MSKFFSATTGAFYAGEFRGYYDAAGTWPTDAVEVADDVFTEFAAAPPAGQVRGSAAGVPAWVAAPVVTPAPVTSVTSTAFLNRFTQPELGALVSNPATVLLLITCAAAGRIDLTDPDVMAGINNLTTAGILAPGRADAILSTQAAP